MTNPIKVSKIPIVLDKERTICYDLNAFCELEEKYGSLPQAVDALRTKSLKAFRIFLWAGLLHEDESLTEQRVGKMLTSQNIIEFSDTLLKAVSESLPEAKN